MNYLNHSLWTSDVASIPGGTNYCCQNICLLSCRHGLDDRNHRISKEPQQEKTIFKETWGKHTNNPHEKIEPTIRNSSFDVLQRQIKCGNNIAQNKFSFVVFLKYFYIGLYMVWVKGQKGFVQQMFYHVVTFTEVSYDRIRCHWLFWRLMKFLEHQDQKVP